MGPSAFGNETNWDDAPNILSASIVDASENASKEQKSKKSFSIS